MSRLAGSHVPVPTTLRSTAGSMALKPGPSKFLWTSTTLTSAPMATLSRVCAAAGPVKARAAARTARIRTSMGWLLSGVIGTREDFQPAGGEIALIGILFNRPLGRPEPDLNTPPHPRGVTRRQK